MLTKPPLVPSKDALRLLRQLAFAGTTLAAIGVVTLNYNFHRQIRLAEQCLETKRQIRALSNGRGDAHMARVIEAAENGQDFSIQAMREQRIRERRFTSSIDKIETPQESGRSQTQHDELRAYLTRERNAQKIRKATVAMTSTPPIHVYGRPKRFTKPTSSWPSGETGDTQPQRPPTPLARIGTISTNAKEAADKIKRATMAMTSTAPAHVFGRPKPAVPEARPNLHGSVASWLSERAGFQTKTDAASALVGPSSTSALGVMVSRQNNTTTSPSTNSVDRPAMALDRHGLGDTESEPTLGSSTFAGKFQRTPTVLHHYPEETNRPIQNIFSKAIEEDIPRQQDPVIPITPSDRDIPLRDAIQARQSVATGLSSLDAVDARSKNTSSALLPPKEPDGDQKGPTSSALPTEHNAQDSVAGKLLTSFQERQADESFSSQETLPIDLTDRAEARKYEAGSADRLLTTDKSSLGSTAKANEASSTWQTFCRIQFQHHADEPKSGFDYWPYLQSLHGSPSAEEQQDRVHAADKEMVEEQQRLSQEGAHAQNVQTGDEQTQVMRRWTPFPKFSAVPMPTNSQRHLDRDVVPEHARWPIDPHKELRQSEDILNKSMQEATAVAVMTAEEKAKLALHIQNVLSSDGLVEGQRAWKTAVDGRLRHKDLAAVDFLYAEFVEKGVVKVSPRHYMTQALVQWHYERGKVSARAAEILFPDPEAGVSCSVESGFRQPGSQISLFKERRMRSLFALRFLQGLWELRANSDWLMLHFRRVIVAAKLRGVKLVEELFALVIRFLASCGNMTTAQAVYDEMVFYHQIEASFLSRTLLLRGYARIGDWYRVEREVEELHYCGQSRSRPHGYALTINAVLQEYAARSSIEQFQNFLIRAVSCWGLVPTSAVSATAIQTYLSQKRYDLVREWMETLQVLFPQIQTETGSFQWLMGNSWQRTGANCEEIEEAIKALAYRNPHTKLKSHSLPMIHEALARDLTVKFDAAQSKTTSHLGSSHSASTEANDFSSTGTIEDHLSSPFPLATSTVSQNQAATPEVFDLHCQLAAAQRLNGFLTGTTSSEAVEKFSFPDSEPDNADANIRLDKGPTPSTSALAHLQDSIPMILTAEFLPEATAITAAILDFYRTRSAHGLPTDHSLLPWIGEKLLQADRAFDAVFVMQKVYGDRMIRQLVKLEMEGAGGERRSDETRPGRESGGFGIEFFEFWMRLAWVTRSLAQWKRVVEEVLHHSRPRRTISSYNSSAGGAVTKRVLCGRVRVTASFVFLTRLVAKRGLRARWSRWRRDDKNGPIDEMVWLLRELENRREQQTGKRDTRKGSRLKDNLI
jgi:hypothetical protein